MESQIKQLKLNATNIKGTLIRNNKELKKLRVKERNLFNRRKIAAKRLQKESFVEGGIPGSGMVAGAARRMAAPAMNLFDRLKEFAGNILLGFLITNLPKAIKKVQEFLDNNRWIIDTLKTTLKITGDLFMVLIDIVNFFNPQKAKLEAEREELEKKVDALFGDTESAEKELSETEKDIDDFVGDELRERTDEEVRSDVITAIKDEEITKPEFVKSVNQYNKAYKLNEVTKSPIVIPGVGSYEKVKTGGLWGFGATIKPVAKDTFGYEITPEEFESRFQSVRSNWTSIKEQLANEGVQGYSQGGTVRPSSSSSGSSFPGESATSRKARESTQTFSIFEANTINQSRIIDTQKENNNKFENLIKNFKELYAKDSILKSASPYELPSNDPRQQGPTILPPGITVDPREIVGYVGSTGRSSGPHIHIETGDGYSGAGGNIPNSVLSNIIVDGNPLNSYRVSGQLDENRRTGKHRGVDYPIRNGAPITLKGGLKFIEYDEGYNSGYGNSLIIEDSNGNKYLLGHLSDGPSNIEALKKLQLERAKGGPNIAPVNRPGYGKGGPSLLQSFDTGSEVVMIMAQQPVIVPGPTRYITRTRTQTMPVPVQIAPKSSGLRSLV